MTNLESPIAAPTASTTTSGDTGVVGRRIGALIIDSIILFILLVVLSKLFGTANTSGGNASVSLSGLPALLFFLATFSYYIVLEALTGQTLGKKLLGIRVQHQGGGEGIGFGPSAIRNLLRVIDALPFAYIIGFITIFATGEKRQRVGDLAAKTQVVKA